MNALHGFAWALVAIAVMIIAVFPTLEGFAMDDGSVQPSARDGWDLASHTEMENSHGSAPAGVHAIAGAEQQHDNRDAPHVTAVKAGNPQNVWPEFHAQP